MTAERAIALACFGAAALAVLYMGATGERWPTAFTAIMVGFGLVMGVVDALDRGRR